MREIVFRAYDKTMKRYKPFDGEHDTMLISRDGKIDYYNLQNGSGFDEYILEQFTGLTDKNGVKIFEGDIVSYEDISGVEDGVGNVLFDLFYGAWFVFVNDYEENSLADVAYNCEIIGNIHDNPAKDEIQP